MNAGICLFSDKLGFSTVFDDGNDYPEIASRPQVWLAFDWLFFKNFEIKSSGLAHPQVQLEPFLVCKLSIGVKKPLQPCCRQKIFFHLSSATLEKLLFDQKVKHFVLAVLKIKTTKKFLWRKKNSLRVGSWSLFQLNKLEIIFQWPGLAKPWAKKVIKITFSNVFRKRFENLIFKNKISCINNKNSASRHFIFNFTLNSLLFLNMFADWWLVFLYVVF